MFKVYILFSEQRNKFYIGETSDYLEERLRRHNSNHKGFTGGSADWRLVYFEEFSDKPTALKREKELKGWKSKRMLQKLIGKEM